MVLNTSESTPTQMCLLVMHDPPSSSNSDPVPGGSPEHQLPQSPRHVLSLTSFPTPHVLLHITGPHELQTREVPEKEKKRDRK